MVLSDNSDQPTVYLAGPLSDSDNPYEWHEQVQETEPDIDWINPFIIHNENATGEEIYNGDLRAIQKSDALLLRRIDNYEVCGAYIEAGWAAGAVGIPTIVWNEAPSPVPEFLEWHAVSICDSLDESVQEVINHV